MNIQETFMQGRTTVPGWTPLDIAGAARLTFLVLATAALLAAVPSPAVAAEPAAKSGDTAVTVKVSPPSVQVIDSATKDSAAKDEDTDTERPRRRRHATVSIDSDRDFESFKDAMHGAPWIVGLIFLVVGSIFLTPVILLIGIVWYKLRKTRMQNEALLRLAEAGVIAPAHAVDAVSTGVMPEAGAAAAAKTPEPAAYQQAVVTRRRVVWSDLRKGVLFSAVGLSFVLYWAIHSGSASWLGMVLLFVGVAYIGLWRLEDRKLSSVTDRPADPAPH